MTETKFLLDSGDPDEYKEINKLAHSNSSELWGATTNPSLIAKKLTGRKITQKKAFELQKDIVLKILGLVPGAVSAEVYADHNTSAEQMVEQGREIATWNERIYVKLPTTLEGFKARTALRKEGVAINNTLVFSQAQIFAICLHEELVQQTFKPKPTPFPPFISPFVGRLDDLGEDGMMLIEHGMEVKSKFKHPLWMLESSLRRPEHIKRGLDAHVEIMTAPAGVYKEWFSLTGEQRNTLDSVSYKKDLKPIEPWKPGDELNSIQTMDELTDAMESGVLDIKHPLTDKGITRFTEDWKAIISD